MIIGTDVEHEPFHRGFGGFVGAFGSLCVYQPPSVAVPCFAPASLAPIHLPCAQGDNCGGTGVLSYASKVAARNRRCGCLRQ